MKPLYELSFAFWDTLWGDLGFIIATHITPDSREGSLEHMKSEWENQNRSLKSVKRSVSFLSGEFERKITESLSPVTRRLSICETDLQRLKSAPPVSPSKPLKEVEFPLQKAQSLGGISSHLTRKHGEMFTRKELSQIKFTTRIGIGIWIRISATRTTASY
jgi:hypothetical protein